LTTGFQESDKKLLQDMANQVKTDDTYGKINVCIMYSLGQVRSGQVKCICINVNIQPIGIGKNKDIGEDIGNGLGKGRKGIPC